jgi:hypothetical protein
LVDGGEGTAGKADEGERVWREVNDGGLVNDGKGMTGRGDGRMWTSEDW